MFYISAYFEANRKAYYERLLAVSQVGDWQGWAAFFLEAVIAQAEEGSTQVRAILQLYDALKTQVVQRTRSQYALYVLDFLFARPLFSSTDFIKDTGIPKRTALRLLAALEAADLLIQTEESSGARPAFYAFQDLLDIVG
jgi:Fic family protein